METRKEFLQSLIKIAQETIWRNELALKYNEEFAEEGKDKEEKKVAAQHAIEKDLKYIEFLNKELSCES